MSTFSRAVTPQFRADHGPGHDLVQQRADDAAVRDGLPALEPRLERRLGPRAAWVRVDREVQALLVELAAGEAVVRLELEAPRRSSAR